MKKLFTSNRRRNHSRSVIIIVLILLVAMTACGQGTAEKEEDVEKITVADAEKEPLNEYAPADTEEDEYVWEFNGNATVFDFAELLAVDDYPYGEWSVKQLVNKFGAPEDISIDTWSDLARVCVIVSGIEVIFFPKEKEEYSFREEVLEDEEYSLDENDMNLEFPVSGFFVFGKERNLPRGIKIGESTKAQIVAAYGEEPSSKSKEVNKYNFNEISYKYAFLEEQKDTSEEDWLIIGEITYLFDNNEEVLSRAYVSWWPGA